MGPWLARLFQVLNTPVEDRQTALDEDLARFPYINGDLFAEHLRFADFNAGMRSILLDACRFDWTAISPAIFGALFQSVMEPVERRQQGAHYTTEKNILKVIEPLFLDGLREEFRRLQARRDGRASADLRRFRERLGTLHFLDPACGCGNFLIIAYRELRALEIDVLRELAVRAGGQQLALEVSSVVEVDQFYGIEIGEFPSRIASTALWMMDHIMNNRLSLEFGQTFARIPIEKSPHIVNADALELDWKEVLAPEDCSYVFGNPPFSGAKFQSQFQRGQVHRIAAIGRTGGTLDYVAAWFLKSGEYAAAAQSNGQSVPRVGFVATNSITQGEQVAQLWPLLFDRYGLEIAFAHRTFAWGSDARGKAHVHVVIVGLDASEQVPARRRLFSYDGKVDEPLESDHAAISPYLIDGGGLANPHVVVREEARPINGFQRLITGSKPIDNGHFIFNAEQRCEFLEAEPDARELLRPFVGAREFLQGGERWILTLHHASPKFLAGLPAVRERIAAVRAYRQASKSKPTNKLAETPTLWHVNVLPTAPFLVVPQVSSERREYVPVGWLEPPVIPSDKLRLLLDASLSDFAFLTSAMHMAWMRTVTGRLESRYMYSVGVVYNTFPTPPGFQHGELDLSALEPLAQAVLDARGQYPEATLANLYDPDLMPPNLRKAHQALDRAVDRLYRPKGFASERERVEHLLMLYAEMRAPLDAAVASKSKQTQETVTRARPAPPAGSQPPVGPRGPAGGPRSPSAGRVRPSAGCETGPARRPGPPPLGTASGRAVVFECQPAPQQEEVQEQAQGHVAVSALPAAALTAAQASNCLTSRKQVSMAQRAPVRYARRAGVTRRGHGKGSPAPYPYRAGSAQHQPDVGARQTAAGGYHPLDGEVGMLRPAAVPRLAAAWTRRRGQLRREGPRLERGRGPRCQPHPRAGHDGRRPFRPHACVNRHLRHAAQPQRGHPVQEVDRAAVALVAAHPARLQRAVGH